MTARVWAPTKTWNYEPFKGAMIRTMQPTLETNPGPFSAHLER